MTTVSDCRIMQEGSRIFTPVRLGFPRQTLDGASYMGHKIPRDTVRLLSGYGLHHRDRTDFTCSARHYEPVRWQPGSHRLRSTR